MTVDGTPLPPVALHFPGKISQPLLKPALCANLDGQCGPVHIFFDGGVPEAGAMRALAAEAVRTPVASLLKSSLHSNQFISFDERESRTFHLYNQ